jgi:hypothetical protein
LRLRSLLTSLALAVGLLAAPGAVQVASAAVTASAPAAAVSSAGCTYRRDGSVWRCITPGAYCPAAAHGRYGYAKVTGKRYKCVKYSNGRWRWKRA